VLSSIRVLTSPSLVLLFAINCYDYGYGTSLRLNERRRGIPPFYYCSSRKAPFPYFHTFSHARCTPSRDFAAAAIRPRQVFTNILHLQYHSQYMVCPILSQSDSGTSAFVLAASEKRPSWLSSKLEPSPSSTPWLPQDFPHIRNCAQHFVLECL